MNNMPAGKFPDCTTISNSELRTAEDWKTKWMIMAKVYGKELRVRAAMLHPKNFHEEPSGLSVPHIHVLKK